MLVITRAYVPLFYEFECGLMRHCETSKVSICFGIKLSILSLVLGQYETRNHSLSEEQYFSSCLVDISAFYILFRESLTISVQRINID
jgi:hypothetical protein